MYLYSFSKISKFLLMLVDKMYHFCPQGVHRREGAEEGPVRHCHELSRTAQSAEISKPGE